MLWKRCIVLVALGLALAHPVAAVVESGMAEYEVPLPEAQVTRTFETPDEARSAQLLPALADFRSGEGAGWAIWQWSPELNAPATLVGPGISLVSPGASRETIQAAVEAFVSRNASLLRCETRDLRLHDIIEMPNGLTYVIFDQIYQGRPVVFGRIDVALRDGTVVLVGSEFYNDIGIGAYPAIGEGVAVATAHLGIPSSPEDAPQGPANLVVLPLFREGAPEYRLAWEIDLKTHEPENIWRTYVDAVSGDLLWRTGLYSFYTLYGYVHADVELGEVNGGFTEVGLEDERLQASGSYNGYTDEVGDWTIEVPNNVVYSVVTEHFGRYCNVNRYDGASAVLTENGTPSAPINFYFDASNSQPSERDAYYYVNTVHDWLKMADPTATQLDYALSTNVNVTTGTCNAYWNGSSINFYREGGGCNNMARISDVVYHEYGHAISQKLYSPNGVPGSLGEAYSDIASEMINNDPCLARYFQVGGGCLRNAENLRQYPGTECGGEIYCLSEILAGAMWKTREFFNMRYGDEGAYPILSQIHIEALRTKPTSFPTYLTRLLMADDTDANLNNGTPNWDEICDGFAMHNLPCPALTNYVTVTATELDDQPQDSGGYLVTAVAVAVGGGSIDPNGVQLFYVADPGGREDWQSVTMTATGVPNEYEGTIPQQACGSFVRYYVRAQKLTGEYATAPENAPYRQAYEFMTGPYEVKIDDDLEAEGGWTLGWTGDTATQGMWERDDPGGKWSDTWGYTQPEDDHSAAGTMCFVTDATGGAWSSYDVDGGKTSVVSPQMDWRQSFAPGDSTDAIASISFWGFFFDYTPVDDTLRCAISNDDGVSWKDLVKIEGMNKNEWTYYKVYVGTDELAFTENMRVRFQMEDINTATTCAEAAIDDVIIRVNACPTDVADGEAAPLRFFVDPGRPNPFNPMTSIRFGIPSAERTKVDIIDTSGRRVATLFDGVRQAGYHSIVWDGRDGQGHPVGSGMYYCNVKWADKSIQRKLMLVK